MARRLDDPDAVLVGMVGDWGEHYLSKLYDDDWMREKRDEVRAFIASALKATAYVKTHRSEVLPLLQEFIGLPDQAMAALAYDALRDVWPDDGLTSSQGLTNAISLAGLPASTPLSRVVDWSIVKEAAAQIKR